MCGILGGNNKEWNYSDALDSIKHRGPDDRKLTEYDSFTMGFVRLAIIDLSPNGMQPMTSMDDKVTITYNGEIYNFVPLRNSLKAKGYVFQSDSDTEIILNAYMEWGDRFVDHFDGMFAIAIYDRRVECVKLFRDRCGIKPLYYYYKNGRFAFASELKALKCLIHDEVLQIDNTAVFDYYNYLYIPDPKTYYKNIYKLEQAHKLVFDLRKKEIVQDVAYWELKVNENEGGTKASKEVLSNIKDMVKNAIHHQLVADVPIGAFLSGGMDSTIISYESLKEVENFNTYSIGFYDYETNELPYVKCLEEKFGFKARKYLVGKDEYSKLFGYLKDWFDEPFADTSAYPTYIVSRLARSKCIVALSGDGGDEIFGGYTRYHELKRCAQKGMSDEELLEETWKIHLYRPLVNREELRKELDIDEEYDEKWFYRKYYHPELPPITRQQYMDFYTYLPCDVLTKTDRVAMANSLEVRVPLLSTDIIEYVFSLTESERCYNGELKYLLKEIYKGYIPNNILYRKKWGFSVPNNFFNYDVVPQDKIMKDIFIK